MSKIFFSDHHTIPLPENHRFPMHKYLLLRQQLQDKEWAKEFEFVPTTVAPWDDILLAHDQSYVDGLISKTLPPLEQKAIGFPLCEELLTRSRSSVQGFISSCYHALSYGFSGNLSGGTHHAHRNKGEGFCVFNDFAVSSLKLLKEKLVKSVLILDLDVHQGNGNSSILKDNPAIIITSLHGEHNYPFRKVPSTYDYPLPNFCTDTRYLEVLELALSQLDKHSFDIVLYQAGVDVLESDKLGKLSLSLEGVYQRDQMVFQWAYDKGLPVAMALGGGYTDPVDDTIQAHLNTLKLGHELSQKRIF